MAAFTLKSYEFRRERERTWLELEAIIGEAEKAGLASLPSGRLLRLPMLYRATLSSLSVARNISLDQNVLRYLESLVTRAYFLVYGVRGSLWRELANFLLRDFPASVRAAGWQVLVATLCLAFGVAVGFHLTSQDPEWFYTFAPADLAADRSPTTPTAELRDVLYRSSDAIDTLYGFAAFLFTHNAAIGMLCFALGFALGVPVIALTFHNGAILGALAAVYSARGLGVEFWAWIGVHGTTELLAVILCGAAGLTLGASFAFPGRHARLENLAQNGRRASRIVIGAVGLFFVAGLLEGFARQLIHEVAVRYMLGAGALAVWAAYFLLMGQRRDERR